MGMRLNELKSVIKRRKIVDFIFTPPGRTEIDVAGGQSDGVRPGRHWARESDR